MVLPCAVCYSSSAFCFFWSPVSRVRQCAFSFYSVVICFSTSLYFWQVFWYSSTILLSCVLKLPLNSSISFVLAVWVCSSPFIRSDDSYTNVAIDLSNLSRFSRIVETLIRVVEFAFLSDKINYLFSVMPVCISQHMRPYCQKVQLCQLRPSAN